MAEKDGKTVYAARKGYNGLVEGRVLKLLKLDHERVAGIANRGGTLIGAGRCEKLKDKVGKRADEEEKNPKDETVAIFFTQCYN